jgi:hypothetical protein
MVGWPLRAVQLVPTISSLILVAAACTIASGPDPPATSHTASSPTNPAASPSRPPVIDLSKAGARQLHVVGDWLTVVDNEIWLAGQTSKNLSIFYRLSPSDGSVVDMSTSAPDEAMDGKDRSRVNVIRLTKITT